MKAARHVAVVGAGPGGLAAGLVLAGSGARVTLFEAQDRVGGRTSSIDLTDGGDRPFRFDCGPTFFLMPYVLGEIFAAAGERLEDHARLTRLDPMYRLLIGQAGGDPLAVDTTQDIPEMARRLATISEHDAGNFQRFIADNRRKLQLSEPILRKAVRSPLDLIDPEVMKVVPMLKPHKSVHALLGEYFDDERTKLVLSFQSKYLGMSPFDCPSLFTILPLIEYEYGVWHPDGGCNALMGAMAEVLARKGVDIRLSTPVRGIEFDGTRATGVVTDDGTRSFDAVVVNADATWALKNLIPRGLRASNGRSRYADRRLDGKRYSCSTSMYYLGLDGAVDLPHHTIYTSARYRENLDEIGRLRTLSEDPSVYVCNPSRLDASLAPPGASSLYVLAPAPNLQSGEGERVDWERDAETMRSRVFDQLERVFGIEDVRERVLCEHRITPEGWAAMNINHGATFNLAHNLGQMLDRRPQNRLKGFRNLYLVGGGTHPGSGLPTIFLSAQISSRLLCEDLGLDCSLDMAPARPVAEHAGGPISATPIGA
ncbi:MAG: phytoene desaturase family protein [Planctomycetota bacterium]